jgi:hypothetical protein
MDDKSESPKNPFHEKAYVKPELKRIPLDDEGSLLEFCRGKPYDAHELEELIKRSLRLKR